MAAASSAGRPKNHKEGVVFPGQQTSTWDFDRRAGQWYFHRFYKHQPDLNTWNPYVRQEIQKIMGFWLQLGVSGFRMDAVPFLLQKRKTMQLYDRGIRRRLAPMLDGDRRRLELAFSL